MSQQTCAERTPVTRAASRSRTILMAYRFGTAALLAALMAGASWIFWSGAIATLLGRRSPNSDAVDFTAFYTAGRLVATGAAHRLFDPAAYAVAEHSYGVPAVARDALLPFLNPPFFALLLAPVARLSFSAAFQVWGAINLGALAIAVLFVWWASRRERLVLRFLLIALMITARPVPFSLQLGQFSLILLAAWTCTFVALVIGRDRVAGISLAICLIKPEIVIPAVLLLAWKRRVTALSSFAVTGAMFGIVSVAMIGFVAAARYPEYIYRVAIEHRAGTATHIMMGWNGLFDSFLGSTHQGLETLLALPASVLTLAAVAYALRGRFSPHRDPAFAAQWLLVTVATILVDPHFYLQDAAIFMAPACFYVLSERGRGRARALAGLLVGWWIMALGVIPNLTWHVALLPVYLAGVGVFLIVELERSRRSADVSKRDEPALPALEAAA